MSCHCPAVKYFPVHDLSDHAEAYAACEVEILWERSAGDGDSKCVRSVVWLGETCWYFIATIIDALTAKMSSSGSGDLV